MYWNGSFLGWCCLTKSVVNKANTLATPWTVRPQGGRSPWDTKLWESAHLEVPSLSPPSCSFMISLWPWRHISSNVDNTFPKKIEASRQSPEVFPPSCWESSLQLPVLTLMKSLDHFSFFRLCATPLSTLCCHAGHGTSWFRATWNSVLTSDRVLLLPSLGDRIWWNKNSYTWVPATPVETQTEILEFDLSWVAAGICGFGEWISNGTDGIFLSLFSLSVFLFPVCLCNCLSKK